MEQLSISKAQEMVDNLFAQINIQPGDPNYTYEYCYNKLKYTSTIPFYIFRWNNDDFIQYCQFKEPLLAIKKH